MPISKKDQELMEQVAAYFESTRKEADPKAAYKPKREDSRSVNDTAKHFNLTRAKVMKMLITMGAYNTSISKAAQELREQGKSIKEIAEELGVSIGTVSSNLPYEDEIHGSDDASNHAMAMRGYRAYEREKAKRQVQKKEGDKMSWKDEWKKETKMSYTETDTRPPRMTWEMADEQRRILETINPSLKDSMEKIELQHQEELENYKRLKKKENKSPEEEKQLAELDREFGFFPGALNDRNVSELERISGDRLPFEPREVIHLHLELDDWWGENDLEIMKKYGGLKGEHISRDIIVPADMPLYALHYTIQRLFGWENSHLHEFELDYEDAKRLTEDKVKIWDMLIGIILRSPLMGEQEEFWADDYNGGSFKNWLKKKYTGPYLSQCYGEGFFACREDMQDVDEEREFYVQTVLTEEGARVIDCIPVLGHDGKKNSPPEKSKWHNDMQRVKIYKFKDMPLDAVRMLFERNTLALLERVRIDSVLHCLDDEEEASGGMELLQEVNEEILQLIKSGEDSPIHQIMPMPVTDKILYHYDFGDNWTIAITATRNCEKLVKNGTITQEQLDKANIKCRELYRPVTIAVDGEMLVDDVGGTHGFVNFLEKINPELDGMSKEEKEEARQEKREYTEWAKSLGWKKLSPWI